MNTIVKDIAFLREPCKEISDIDGEGMKLTDELLRILTRNDNGIGLAANQIGVSKKACVISVPVEDEEGLETKWARRFINPEILSYKKPFIFTREGCLSFPGRILQTVRYNEIEVKDSLNPHGVILEGLEAVVATHEINHLYGKTMFDFTVKSIGPNGKCPCESGKKFKKCCYIKVK